MPEMDRYRRIGGWLWVLTGLAVQAAGLAGGWARPGLVTWLLVGDIAALGLVLLLAPGRPARVLGRVTVALLAADLLGAVLDRFGVLGGPGSPGVSWGDWDRFRGYTAVLLHHPGAELVTGAAVGATVVELALAGALVAALAAGWQPRWTGKVLAGLFGGYLVAMAASPARQDVLRCAVPVLIGGALLVSATPTSAIRVPAALARESVDA